jgi:Raf kinase inhibitor-like YbhB/YbcL family protein
MAIKITSAAFEAGGPIPAKHTSEGADVSPLLSWTGTPGATKELALICDDPDAPQPTPWVHWVIYKIPAATASLPEGVATGERLASPAGAVQGKNSWGTIGYQGPEPPKGHGVHHYHFRIYALDTALDAKPGLDKDQLLAAMEGHILATGEVVGTYERK